MSYPSKGPNDYATNELHRFTLEAGRATSKLYTDQEAAIEALANAAVAKLGMGLQMPPSYYKHPQGYVEMVPWTMERHEMIQ